MHEEKFHVRRLVRVEPTFRESIKSFVYAKKMRKTSFELGNADVKEGLAEMNALLEGEG